MFVMRKLARGLLCTLIAAVGLTEDWRLRIKYFYIHAPWWINNKFFLQESNDVMRLKELLTEDKELIGAEIQAHLDERKRVHDLMITGEQSTQTVAQLSANGGSMVGQMVLLGGADHVAGDLKDQQFVSAIGHLLDCYVDQEEDAKENTYNYWNNAADPKPVEEWIEQLKELRAKRHAEKDFVRYLDGVVIYNCVQDPKLYELVKDFIPRSHLMDMLRLAKGFL